MADLRTLLIAVVPLLFSAAIFIAGNGLFGTLLAVRLDLEAVPVDVIGLILACYSVGWVIGTLICPAIINRVGHIRTFAAFAALATVSALLHPLVLSGMLWAALRILTGLCMASLYTILESWLNAKATDAVRGSVMGAYMAVNFLAFGIGQFLITAADPAGFQAFTLVAVLICLSLVPLTLSRVESPPEIHFERLTLHRLITISPLGLAGCLCAGLVTGAFNAMAPVYARGVDPTPGWVAQFMLMAVLGGFVLQFPMGRLSDRFDRRRVILGLTVALGAISAAIAMAGAWSVWLLGTLVVLHGGIAYTLYPISLAHASDRIAPADLVPTSAGLLLWFGVGAVAGPPLAALAMGRLGSGGLFQFFAVIGFVLAAFTAWRMARREPVPNEEQGAFVAVAQTTPEATLLDPRAESEAAQLSFDFVPRGTG